MNNPSKPKRHLSPLIAEECADDCRSALLYKRCDTEPVRPSEPPVKPPNIRIIQKTDSNAQVANFS